MAFLDIAYIGRKLRDDQMYATLVVGLPSSYMAATGIDVRTASLGCPSGIKNSGRRSSSGIGIGMNVRRRT